MLKQIFKESGGVLVLHSLNGKYRDKIISAKINFVIGQFWRWIVFKQKARFGGFFYCLFFCFFRKLFIYIY